jgi:signal transduction histidine kinase
MSVEPRPAQSVLWRTSVTLLVVGAVALLLQLGIVIVHYGTDEDFLFRAMTDQESDAISDAVTVRNSGKLKVDLPPDVIQRYRKYPHGYGFEIVDAEGTVMASANLDIFPPKITRRGINPEYAMTCIDQDQGSLCVSTRRIEVEGKSYWLNVAITAQSAGIFSRIDPAGIVTGVFVRELIDDVGVPMVPILIALLLVNVLAVRHALRPLHTAAAAVQQLDPSNEKIQLQEEGLPREVKVLVHAINDMLARVDRAMMAQREFTANAAHELRTPLAVLMLRLGEIDGPAADRLRADVRAMARLVDQLLEMARADALTIEPNATVDLAAIGRDTVENLAILALDQGRELEFEDRGGDIVPGNENAVRFALRNLVENALRHSPMGRAVQVVAGPGAQIQVVDHGKGIPPGQHDVIFRRFWRGDATTSGSIGLGLAIVKRVADAHGARIIIGETDGGGATIRLIFGNRIEPDPRRATASDRQAENDRAA